MKRPFSSPSPTEREAAHPAILVTDARHRVVGANAGLERITGRSSCEIVGKTCGEVLGCGWDSDLTCGDVCGLKSALQGQEGTQLPCVKVARADGTLISLEPLPEVLRDAEGRICGGVLVLKDERAQSELERIRASYLERVHHHMNLARKVQEKLLEPSRLEFSLGSLSVQFRAFNEPSMELSGDFYRIFQPDESTAVLVVGDVQGKGVSAALVMAMTLALFEEAVRATLAPSEIMEIVNRRFWSTFSSAHIFVTAAVLVIDLHSGLFRLSRAGHEMPLLIEGKNVRDAGQCGGMPLGIEEAEHFGEELWAIAPPQCWLLFTDGLIEIGDPLAPLLNRRVIRRLARNAARNGVSCYDVLLSSIPAALLPGNDDVTFMTLEVV